VHAPEDIIAILQFVDAKKFCIFKVAYRDTKIKVEKRRQHHRDDMAAGIWTGMDR
jgi:hypothetical protein